jgi:hypothetical protein
VKIVSTGASQERHSRLLKGGMSYHNSSYAVAVHAAACCFTKVHVNATVFDSDSDNYATMPPNVPGDRKYAIVSPCEPWVTAC